MEFSNSENFFNSLDNCCFLSGKKPQNKNLSEKPLIETAAATAEGPGMGNILISLLIIGFIIWKLQYLFNRNIYE